MKFRRLTAAAALMAVTLGMLGGCAKSDAGEPAGDGETAQAEPIVLENAFIATDVPMEGFEQGYMDITVAGGKLFYFGNEPIEETDDSGITSVIGIITQVKRADLDGKNVEVIWEKEIMPGDSGVETGAASSGASDGYESVSAFAVDDENNLWLFVNRETYDEEYGVSEQTVMLTKYAPDGTELVSADVSEAISDAGYFYARNLCFGGEGKLCAQGERDIFVFDTETAELDFKITESSYIYGMCATNTGDVVYVGQPQAQYEIKKINFEAETIGEIMPYTGGVFFSSLAAGYGDHSFYAMGNDYIYGFNLDTMTTDVIVNFTDSDIDSTYLSKIISLPDNNYLVTMYDWNTGNTSVSILSPNPNPVIEGKVLLTLGTLYSSPETRAAVRQFNRSSDVARISIIDYSQFK